MTTWLVPSSLASLMERTIFSMDEREPFILKLPLGSKVSILRVARKLAGRTNPIKNFRGMVDMYFLKSMLLKRVQVESASSSCLLLFM